MKRKILIIIIYLSGYVCSYTYGKYTLMQYENKWTKSDRAFTLVLSLGSWLSVVAVSYLDLLNTSDTENADW